MSRLQETQALYQSKKKTIPEALALIRDGDAIFSSQAMSEPVELMKQLHTIAGRGVKGCLVTSSLPQFEYEFLHNPDYAESITCNGWFYTAPHRQAAREGRPHLSYVPNHMSLVWPQRLDAMREDGRRMVLLTSCSPMDEHGYLTFSLTGVYERPLMEAGAIVIAEVNPRMPRVFGDTVVHISELAAVVEVDYPAGCLPDVPVTAAEEAIAGYIAERIEDGSTIQLGIGGIPNALVLGLKDKRHLGIHTEMITDGMVDLITCGAVDNSMKTVFPHKTVGSFAMGTQKLYDFIDNNPTVMLMRGSWANDPCIIGKNYKMQSINTSLEIDLFGQCASESIGPVQFSGTGGQVDTATGAQRSEGGHSFICVRSTANVKGPDGSRTVVSKIVPALKPGTAVTLSRNNVDYVVSEYGIVNLRGRSLKERAERLISIAHPDFREDLRAYVRQHPEIF